MTTASSVFSLSASSTSDSSSVSSNSGSKTSNNSNSNSNNNNNKQRKTNSLAPETVEYLKAWIMSPEHIAHPYPTEQEKVRIMTDTGIEMKQLTNWFVNNRKRYWKPRVEARLQQQAHAAAAAAQVHAQVAAVAAVAAAVSGHVNAVSPDANRFRPSFSLPTHNGGFMAFDLSSHHQQQQQAVLPALPALPVQAQPQPAPTAMQATPLPATQTVQQDHILQSPVPNNTIQPQQQHLISPTTMSNTVVNAPSNTNNNTAQTNSSLHAVSVTSSSSSSFSGSDSDSVGSSTEDEGCDHEASVHEEEHTEHVAIHTIQPSSDPAPINVDVEESTDKQIGNLPTEETEQQRVEENVRSPSPVPLKKRKMTADPTASPRPKYRRVSLALWRQSCQEAPTPCCDSLPSLEEATQLFGFSV